MQISVYLIVFSLSNSQPQPPVWTLAYLFWCIVENLVQRAESRLYILVSEVGRVVPQWGFEFLYTHESDPRLHITTHEEREHNDAIYDFTQLRQKKRGAGRSGPRREATLEAVPTPTAVPAAKRTLLPLYRAQTGHCRMLHGLVDIAAHVLSLLLSNRPLHDSCSDVRQQTRTAFHVPRGIYARHHLFTVSEYYGNAHIGTPPSTLCTWITVNTSGSAGTRTEWCAQIQFSASERCSDTRGGNKRVRRRAENSECRCCPYKHRSC